MPILGLGVFQIDDASRCEQIVRDALRAGYRLIDTAAAYGNEEAVGRAVKRSGIPREDIFITTKVWVQDFGYEQTKRAVAASLEKLDMPYIDLVLLHQQLSDYYGSWRALQELCCQGTIRAIGVSKFYPDRLADLCENADILPAVNQIECHPLWNRKPLIAFCRSHGIAVQAYAPLARGLYLNREIMQQLAEKYVRTEAQIGLRYLVQQGISVIPKSTQPDRIFANADVFDFELSEADMALIDTMDEQLRSASIPDDLL